MHAVNSACESIRLAKHKLVCARARPQEQARMRGALFALRILARKYEFKDEEERGPLAPIVAGFLPPLLQILQVGAE